MAKHADDLVRLSQKAEWKVFNNPKYELYSTDFRRNAEALIQNAKDKNTDGAALAYVDLTLSCVKCHKHVREVRMVRYNPRVEPVEASFEFARRTRSP